MPDKLMKRAKVAVARRGMTFKDLVVDAVERVLKEEPVGFSLRDASAGYTPANGKSVSSCDVNAAIDSFREPRNAV